MTIHLPFLIKPKNWSTPPNETRVPPVGQAHRTGVLPGKTEVTPRKDMRPEVGNGHGNQRLGRDMRPETGKGHGTRYWGSFVYI